ncbi:MAG: histidine kinase [Massilia sp.]|nr:histidine kinase [Massilia sp.]
MRSSTAADIQAVQALGSVPTMLRVVSETTGLGFICIARVDAGSWTTCAVYDKLGFGLQPGDTLELASTLCNEVRQNGELIVMNQASAHPHYRDHHTPRLYGFESYISVPVYRPDGNFFGTLCGLDPKPAELDTPRVIDTMLMFADLVSRQLADEQRMAVTETALLSVREAAELREQFIAVLGHDVRTPLSSILTGAALLRQMNLGERAEQVIGRIERSGKRISSLVDDVVDFTQGRMGDGIAMTRVATLDLQPALTHAIEELRAIYPQRRIDSTLDIAGAVLCDPRRMAQMLSNLLSNALIYGARDQAVRIDAATCDGVFSLTVSNGGAPLSETTLAALFQPFWRGDNHQKHSGGLGLGLYIVAEIARAHGGAMQVTSNAEATTFSFSMPMQAENQDAGE